MWFGFWHAATTFLAYAMRAVVISRPGPAEVLEVQERPAPVPNETEVLVRVKAAGINRADVSQRKGHYPAPAGVVADIPGLEISGIIESCGAMVTRWKAGDSVCALLAGGGYAEEIAVDARHCLPVPPGWSLSDAAALPEAIFTVWSNVFQRGRLRRGENFLVHGGSSGIGMAAIQLARLFGARVFATAGNAEKCRACEVAGAERCINYRESDFVEELKDVGLDVVLDMVGGEYFSRNLKLLRPDGRLVFINAMKGAKVELNLLQMMTQRVTITGSTLRGREAEFKAALANEIETNVWPLLSAGKFRANVFRTFSFDEAAEAHRLMETSAHIGKLVLNIR